MGFVLAQHDHDDEGPKPLGANRLRRPPLRDHGHERSPAESVQARDRAAPGRRGAVEYRPFRPRIRRLRRPGRPAEMGPAAGFGPAKDLRSPAGAQRYYLYRYFFDARVLHAAQNVQ